MIAPTLLRTVLSVAVVAIACLVAQTARAQDVQGSCVMMMCCGSQCACGDDSCCNSACGIGGGSSGGDSSGGGGGLIGALFDAILNPAPSPPPDPAAAARAQAEAEAAAARRAAELAEAKADYDAAVARTTDRESRGRDLYAAWVALQNALHDAHDRSVSADAALKLLAPLPLRARTPIAASDQASCAAFHSSLALSMGVWRETSAPPMDPTFLDAERISHDAGTVFDRGESIAGCDQMASLSLPSAAGARGPPGDGRAQAAFVARAVQDLRPAAQALEQAQRNFDAAEAAYIEAKTNREKADVARAAEQDRLDTERNDRDGGLRKAEADRKKADEDEKKAEPPAWRKAHLKQDEIDAFSALARAQAEAKAREEQAKSAQIAAEAAQKAFKEKAEREKAEQEARERQAQEKADAEKRARDAQKQKLEQEEQAADAATEALSAPGKAKPRPVITYPTHSRIVRHRRDP